MNIRTKVILLLALVLVSVLLVTSCGEEPPYEEYDENGYRVSVRYDANGGILTDGVSIIMDTYSLGSLPEKNGVKVIQLTDPENVAVRGDVNKFVPDRNGYSFVGWYAERTEVIDENGNVTYKYSKKWDFKKDRLEVDPNGEYSSSNPVITLYAGWVPNVTVEFYLLSNPNLLVGTKENIVAGGTIDVPRWDVNMNDMFMGDFPEIDGRTYIAAYTDPEGKNRITGETLTHTGIVDDENLTVENPVMKVYVDAWAGEWNYVYSYADFYRHKASNGSGFENGFDLEGNYVVMADIDFLEIPSVDPTLIPNVYYTWEQSNVTGAFSGKLVGITKDNGERVKIMNVNFTQAYYTPPKYNGLFGEICAGAVIENIDFENIIMNIDQGSRAMSVGYGLLAGKIDKNATINNVSLTGTIKISASCMFNKGGQIMIGLVCGDGYNHEIDYSGVTVEQIGTRPGFGIEVIKDSVYVNLP